MGGNTPDEHVTETTEDTKQRSRIEGSTTGETTGTATGAQDVALPEYLKSFIQGVPGVSLQALQDIQAGTQGFQLPSETTDTLRQYAGGDFLFGGPQQQAFIDAAVRSAMPGINSAFGAAGRGGSGLYNNAIGQSAIDAFAHMFPQQQQYQLQAAELLPKMQMMPLQLQQQLLQSASGLPAQFAPLFGQTTSGETAGTTAGTSLQKMKGSSSTVGTETQPIYETPWWQTALGAGSALAGLAMPGLGGVSAAGNIMSGASGLLGSFR